MAAASEPLTAAPEAPVPVLRFEREERRLGGAANVAANIRALGGTPILAGVVGEDVWGALLRRDLAAAGIEAALVGDAGRPTTSPRTSPTSWRRSAGGTSWKASTAFRRMRSTARRASSP